MNAVLRVAIAAPAACLLLAGCIVTDPVHQSDVDALGPEAPGVPQGEFHRAGQPCGVCHGGKGPASSHFSVAGTVFAGQTDKVGIPNVQILLVDSDGTNPSTIPRTNCAGNFYVLADVSKGGWDPQFPIETGIAGYSQGAQMIGHIGRDASCNTCHFDPAGLNTPGHVYLNVMAPGSGTCP
jgi:hypothetical protein